jgi:predicted dehydrogenase
MFNVGVIGHGWAASAHIPAINATGQARITSALSSRQLDGAQLPARHGGPIHSFTRLDDFLAEPDLDVVDITSHPWNHPRHAIAAARAGKHLILEKPVAFAWPDCWWVEQAVRQAGVKVCVGFECRYAGQFRTIKSVIDQGLLSAMHYGDARATRRVIFAADQSAALGRPLKRASLPWQPH